MNKQLTKYALIVLIAGVSIATLPMFEMSYDGEEIKINGQNINEPSLQHNLTEIALMVGGSYFASKIPNGPRNVIIPAGGLAGSVLADVLYGKATQRRIFEKTGRAVGGLVGESLDNEAKQVYIKDAAAFGGRIAEAVVSQIYGDAEQRNVHLGKATGEQLGMYLFSSNDPILNQQEIGRVLGINIGAAISTNNRDLKNFYFIKAALQPIFVQAIVSLQKRVLQQTNNYIFYRLVNKISDNITDSIAHKISESNVE